MLIYFHSIWIIPILFSFFFQLEQYWEIAMCLPVSFCLVNRFAVLLLDNPKHNTIFLTVAVKFYNWMVI